MNDHEAKKRGERAAILLADPMLGQAFADVRAAILQKIEEAPLRDRDGVHELKLMLKLLKDVRGNLDSAVRDGKISAFTIEQTEKRKKFGLF